MTQGFSCREIRSIKKTFSTFRRSGVVPQFLRGTQLLAVAHPRACPVLVHAFRTPTRLIIRCDPFLLLDFHVRDIPL
jgi:hypothetical protein